MHVKPIPNIKASQLRLEQKKVVISVKKHSYLPRYQQTLTNSETYFFSDITCVQSNEGTHYLTLVTDAYSRKIMRYHLSKYMSSKKASKNEEMKQNNKKKIYSTLNDRWL